MGKITTKVDGSRALVNAKALNHVYDDLVVLGYETKHIAEMWNHTTLKTVQVEIKRICFGYAKCYGKLDCLIRGGEK